MFSLSILSYHDHILIMIVIISLWSWSYILEPLKKVAQLDRHQILIRFSSDYSVWKIGFVYISQGYVNIYTLYIKFLEDM